MQSPMSIPEANTGTKPVAEQHAFDVAALERYLPSTCPASPGRSTVEQFKGGQSNPTYKLADAGARLRDAHASPGPASKLLPSAHAIEREFRVMRGAAPTPTCRCRAMLRAVRGRERHRPRLLRDGVRRRAACSGTSRCPAFDAAGRGAIYDEMNRVIAALHSVDPQAVGLADYGKPGNYFERQIGRWTKQYLASITEPIEAMDRLIEWLPAHIPASARDDIAGRRSCTATTGSTTWSSIRPSRASSPCSTGSCRRSAIRSPTSATTACRWHIPPGIVPRHRRPRPSPRSASRASSEYVRRYCERTGRGDPDAVMADWNFYLAYNLFRIAGILQGIAKRVEAGTAVERAGAPVGAGARPLAEMGWRIAQQS